MLNKFRATNEDKFVKKFIRSSDIKKTFLLFSLPVNTQAKLSDLNKFKITHKKIIIVGGFVANNLK